MEQLHRYEHGIYAIDSHYTMPVFDAIHLIVENGHAALVDTAHNDAAPRIFEALAELGLTPDAVDYVILTHVHLDHAGGAGAVMQGLPKAKLVVHPRGARHMIEPAKLQAAVREVYGEVEANRLYGELIPVPAERVIEASHGMTLDLAGRTLRLFETPGHAKHHIAIHDSRSGKLFTGDTFGISYRQLDSATGKQFIFPTTSPSQFDLAAAHATLDMLAALKPEAIYVTHYAEVRDIPRMTADMHRMLDDFAAIARKAVTEGKGHAGIAAGLSDYFLAEAAREGWGLQGQALLDHLATDIDLNAQGLEYWLLNG